MTQKDEKDRLGQILDVLSAAASKGRYEGRLDFTSPDDPLGRVADAVNSLLEKTEKRITSLAQFVENQAADARRYRHIIDAIEESYFEVDLKGNLFFFNDSVIRELGYTEEELRGIHFSNLVDKANAQYLYDVFHGVYLSGRAVKSFDWKILKKNKEPIDVESSVALLRDDQGKSAGFRGVVRDITRRKQAEDALRESESHYRFLTEKMTDIIWIADLNLRTLYVSPSVQKILGFSREERMNQTVEEQLTPASLSFGLEAMAGELALEKQQLGDPERSATLVLEYYHKDGSTRWMETVISGIRNDQGGLTGFHGVSRNITEHKKAEEALAESEKRYRMIVDNVNDMVWVIDFGMRLTYVSESTCRVTGFSNAESRNMFLEDLLTPESFGLIAQTLAEELTVENSDAQADPNRFRTLELEAYSKGGGNLWLEVNITFSRDSEGKATEVLAVGRNITQRRITEQALAESEKLYRMIVENMNEAIWTMDFNFQYIFLSPAIEMLTGYTPDEIRHIPLEDQLTPESMAAVSQVILEEFEPGNPLRPRNPETSRVLELEILRKDGSHLWQELTLSFNRDDRGNPFELLGVARDISERKKAEDEKDQLEKQLVQAQKLETVGRLAGGVAHDFNNMLGVILGYVDLVKLKLGRLHPVVQDIDEIEKAAVRSRDITSQLLAFSRKQIIAPKIVDLNDLVANSQKTLLRLIGEDVRLTYHPGANLWAVKIDPSQVEQILINLAVNARDAMPAGGILTIATENITLDSFYCRQHIGATPGHYVRLSVSDNGTGMDEETLDHIFEPFFTTKETGKGTGLGLPMIYGIVNQNNGFIHVYSEPEHGTTFTVFLPRTEEDKKIPALADDETILPGNETILIVEDDAMVLKITRGMLESIGYCVMTTESPVDALSIYEKQYASIDLVITDVIMPAMSGKYLRDRLVEKNPDVRVLFMSGYTSDVIVHHGVLDSHVKFLQKPFTLRDLDRKVREVLSSE